MSVCHGSRFRPACRDMSKQTAADVMSECPTCGAPRPAGKSEEYMNTVAHLLKTFEARYGAKYPFGKIEGSAIKRLLGFYSSSQVRGLWDAFLQMDSEWLEKVGHTIMEFQRQIPCLLDKSDWKSRAKKYEGEINREVQSLASTVFRPLKEPE